MDGLDVVIGCKHVRGVCIHGVDGLDVVIHVRRACMYMYVYMEWMD